MRTAAAIALVAGLAGCGPETPAYCNECMPPAPIAAVTITDARTGLPVAGAVVTGGDATWTCSDVTGKTECTSIQLTTTGAFDAAVTAPGYDPATVHLGQELRYDACCPPSAVYTAASVQLTPA